MYKTKEKGFTLVEAVIGMGIMAAMSVGLMSMTKNMHKGQATSETKMEELELRRIIATTLTDKTACQKTLVGKNIGTPITQIKNATGTILYEKGKIYGNNTLKISDIVTQDQSQVFSDGTRAVNLIIGFQKMKSIVALNIKNANIALRVKATSAEASITDCFADADSIVQQACLAAGGSWTGSSCTFPQYVLKSGDTMTGTLTAPSFSGDINGITSFFSGKTTATKFCTGANCKAMYELALANQSCPNGQVQTGVATNGTVNCKPLQCPTNQFFAGLDASNNAVCRPYPTKTCPTNQYVSEVNADGSVTCAILPNNANSTCPLGQVIQSISAGIPTCVNKGAGTVCSTGEVITAVAADGSVTCEEVSGDEGSETEKFEMSCSSSPVSHNSIYSQITCCRITKENGEVICKNTTNGTIWNSLGIPFTATTLSLYSLACFGDENAGTGCCRINMKDGNVSCKNQNSGNWYSMNSPF